MVDQNDSIIELSTLEATRPMEPSRPAVRSRCPNTDEVYSGPRFLWTMVPVGRRRQVAICMASTTSSERTWQRCSRDGPADHLPGEHV